MRISIRHSLRISPPPGTGHLVLQLLMTPQSGPTQAVESWSVDVAGIDKAALFTDAYGNSAHLVNQAKPDGTLTVTVSGVVETRDSHGVLGRPGGEPVPALYKRMTPLTRVPVTVYGKFRGGKDSRLDVLHGLMLRVSETLGGASEGESGPGQTQSQGSQSQALGGMSQTMGGMTQSMDGMSQSQTVGETELLPADEAAIVDETGPDVVVRLPRPPATDYAHMFIGAARALGIPARYVTGYLVGEGDEPARFHAWAEALDEKLGWIGFDPMLELCPTDRHVRLAVGLDALSAAPLRCVPAGDGVTEVKVVVERV